MAIPWDGSFTQLDLIDFPEKQKSFTPNGDEWSFDFLNIKQLFNLNEIDWSFCDYGMLWTYNLNYFDWLNQADLTKEQGLKSLSQFYARPANKNPIILHPYPTSLRIINVSKFICKLDVEEDWLYHELVSDLKFLSGRLEFHLLANHLLENAFALYIGGLITGQAEFTNRGKKLLEKEIKEQILNDGMHYERSPMYHLIILERLLDALNFAMASNDNLESVLRSYAFKMTGLAINWEGLDRIPMMQDSAYGIAQKVPVLLEYSKSLLGEEFPSVPSNLKDSGYRRLTSGDFNLFANVGSIGPSYQPGHAHADELNFELFYQGTPIIVDTGLSTYENNDRRHIERSTESHNCITIGKKNSSDVWSSFRVGKREFVKLFEDSDAIIVQKGKKQSTLIVKREFVFSDNTFTLFDKVEKPLKRDLAFGHIHFHPSVSLVRSHNNNFVCEHESGFDFKIEFTHTGVPIIESYQYCNGFNRTQNSFRIKYQVSEMATFKLRVII